VGGLWVTPCGRPLTLPCRCSLPLCPPHPPPPQSKPEAQIEFTKSRHNASMGNLWHLPDRNYSFVVNCGASEGTAPFSAQFFGLDTNGADSNARKKHKSVREDLKW
jgi:hypothetical protein